MWVGHEGSCVRIRNVGETEHVYRTIHDTFPVLDECGGYTLLCLTLADKQSLEIPVIFAAP